MKKILFLLIAVLLYGDISDIITYIKKMESYTPEFKRIVNYNVFSDIIEEKSENLKINGNISNSIYVNKNIAIYAVFQNKININGQWYKIGDIVYGYKIVKITNDKVFLKKNNRIKIIEFKTSVIKVIK